MYRIMLGAIGVAVLACSLSSLYAEPAEREPYGIDLEGFAFPYPVGLMSLVNGGEPLRMADMDALRQGRTAGPPCFSMAAISRRAIGRR
jgi:hypothetical protein